jgi:signal transduction histidine kinase
LRPGSSIVAAPITVTGRLWGVITARLTPPHIFPRADRATVPVELNVDNDGRLPSQIEAAAYYVVSECLANIAKYAQASTVAVRVERKNGSAIVEIVDDGVGGADPERGSGLRGLIDRVEALEGTLAVESRRGEGTTICASIPCERPDESR